MDPTNGLRTNSNKNPLKTGQLLNDQRRAFTLIEVMVGMVLLSVAFVALFAGFRTIFQSRDEIKNRTNTANVMQALFTKLDNIPYAYIVTTNPNSTLSFNSTLPYYGIAFATNTFGFKDPAAITQIPFQYFKILDEMKESVRFHGFDSFSMEVRFMIRDKTDQNGDGRTTDLRYYFDANNDLVDDLDTNIRYQDINNDSDYFDTYDDPERTEEPNTHIKEVVLRIHDEKGGIVAVQSKLISWEKLSGLPGKADGATLVLIVDTPVESSVVYSLESSTLTSSWNDNIYYDNTTEETDMMIRADTTVESGSPQPLKAKGTTSPSADVEWKLDPEGDTLDICSADGSGKFDCELPNVTAQLIEGTNTLYAQAAKSIYFSPLKKITLSRDKSVPKFIEVRPVEYTTHLQPVVFCVISDTVSALIPEATTLGIVDVAGQDLDPSKEGTGGGKTWQKQSFKIANSSGAVLLIDPVTKLPPTFAPGIYNLILEVQDYAGYKIRFPWTITILDMGGMLPDVDDPLLISRYPTFTTETDSLPLIRVVFKEGVGTDVGFDFSSIVVNIDGADVVSNVIGNIHDHWEFTESLNQIRIFYQVTTPLSPGAHTYNVTVMDAAGQLGQAGPISFTVVP